MPLFKLRLDAASAEAGHRAAALLGGAMEPAASATTVFEAPLAGYVVEAYFDAPPAADAIARLLAGAGAGLGVPQFLAVPEENWVALSQSALPPVAIGGFTIYGSHDRPRMAWRRHALEIEAGEAFGTGRNPTTGLCLESLWQLTRRRRFTKVLDLGCGTGILAIAAACALPAARVVGIDNDPIAAAVAAQNVRLNRVASQVRVVAEDLFRCQALRAGCRFDLVLANILAGPLIALAPLVRAKIAPGGFAILSGLLNEQAREVAAVWCAAGFVVARRCSHAGWTALVLRGAGRRLMP
jgi:ribosomal protein L11 methyltransferase